MKSPILVVGAGIGGLTSALALARQGFDVEIFEQSPVLTDLGAGLQISPNASRILHELGLQAYLEDAGFQPEAMQVRHWRRGSVLSQAPLGKSTLQRWGAAYYHVHRGDLQQMLLAAVRGHARIRLHLGTACEAVDQDADQINLTLATSERHKGHLLVGADGIHSTVRARLFGEEAPRFTGHVAWRFLVPAEAIEKERIPPVAGLWMGPGAHFVHYYVRGGRYVNCVAVVEQSEWVTESWTERGDKQSLREDFAGWHSTIQRLIEAADMQALYRWGLFDREPMPQWHQGRAVLLGDACHPTLPFLAQGAAMAIEDAASLARGLTGGADVAAALDGFYRQRIDRVSRVQQTSRRNGRIYHLRGLPALGRNLALRSGLANPLRTMDWLYRY